MKIGEIKELLQGKPTAEQLAALKQDERAGVQKLLLAYQKRVEKEAAERERFAHLLQYEREYLSLPGIQYVAGVDGGHWPDLW